MFPTVPVVAPTEPLAVTLRVLPDATEIGPVKLLAPLRVSTFGPSVLTPPLPLIVVATVRLSERLKASVPLSVTAPPPSVPVVEPLPT